ncbi:cytochrome C [Thauera sp.]|jgi:cytochrome c553|uniref:c-type cytochrome n=1 Tax=Thauera sp. TaxID=1905334 RepID=UPI002613504D|nr:cytochrome C [Thauera sp.]
MRSSLLAGALALTTASGSACAEAPAQDPHLARNLAATCATCHGTAASLFEPLAGQPRAKLLQTLDDFRSGRRDATIMHQIVRGYSDAQLELIAGWFARQHKDGGER